MSTMSDRVRMCGWQPGDFPNEVADELERLQTIIKAQQALIGEYENVTDRSEYSDEDYADDEDFGAIREAEAAVEAAMKARADDGEA